MTKKQSNNRKQITKSYLSIQVLIGIFRLIPLLMVCYTHLRAQNTPETIQALADRVIYLDESYVDSFLVYAKIIERKSRQINYQRGVCDSYRLMGIYHECRAEYAKAIGWHLKNLALSDAIKDNESKLSALSDLSSQFHFLKQYEKAKFYVKEAIRLSEQIPTKPKRVSSFYLNLGIFYRATHQADSALISYQKSLAIKRKIQDSTGIANVNLNISTLLIDQQKYNQAQPYLDYNIKFRQRKKGDVNIWFDYINQSIIYTAKQQYELSKLNLDLALQIAKNIKSKQKEAETYEQFVHLYRKQGNYQKALDMSQKFQKLTSEIINIETNKNAAELQEKYEADKREQQNKLLEADIETQKWQKQTIGIVACGLTLILLITGLAWWQIKNKNLLLNHKNEELQAQKKQLENTLERLHQMREQLILSEKMASIGQLTAGIAHEINNPINFVSNNVQALKMDLTDIIQLMTKKQRENPHFITLNEEIQTLTESIERGIDRTQHIVNGLRIFARNEEAEFAKVDLHRCIDEALTLLSFEIKNRCQIIKRYGDITSVNGLHSKLNQVFLNILTNAVQAIWSIHPDSSSPTGSIEIVTLQAINMIEVRITDNGVGMDEETQKRIFEPFFTTKPIGEGTGLGMAICYGIILHHHGIISVSSKKGYGTTVLIELPI